MYDIINLQKMKERKKDMTVKDLINKLNTLPQDATVLISARNWDSDDIDMDFKAIDAWETYDNKIVIE